MDAEIFTLLIAFSIMLCGAIVVFFQSLFKISNRSIGWTSFAFLLIAFSILLFLAVGVFVSGEVIQGEVSAIRVDALNASLHFCIDRLSSFFIVLVIMVALPVTLFSITYMEREEETMGFYSPLLLFIIGMLGVFCLDDFFFFFIPWEFMSLSAYALILFDKRDPQVLRAGIKYFIVTHFGNVSMFIGALTLYFQLPAQEASFSFSAISRSMQLMQGESPFVLNFVLVLFFIGFATKAGVVPFGFLWLPDAHPVAPSPVSALLSGVMIKVGVYGLIRTFLFLLPVGEMTFGWGWVVAVFGTLSLFFGTLRAMMQHDSKILLAYHSIGQMGYILLALGLGMAFIESCPVIAMLALVAGLYHLLNHACFKGLLFLNAGSVIHRTGTRDMDKVGGLSRVLPWTSVTALVAVLSIGGLPGFSGFVSKWMIYQASVFGSLQVPWAIIMGITAIFISVVTIVSMLKFYAAQFLGQVPDALREETGRGEDFALTIPQVFLAALCVLLGTIPVLGVLPGFTIFTDFPLLNSATYERVFGEFSPFKLVLHAESQAGDVTTIGVWNPLLTISALCILGFLGYLITRSAGAETRTVDNWYCGSVVEREETIYRASSYYVYLKEVFRFVNIRFVPGKISVKTDVSRIFSLDSWFYSPLARCFLSLSRWFARSHVGFPQVYLLWTVIGAVVTLATLLLISMTGGQ